MWAEGETPTSLSILGKSMNTRARLWDKITTSMEGKITDLCWNE